MAKKKTKGMEEKALVVIAKAKSMVIATDLDRSGAQQYYLDVVDLKKKFEGMYDDQVSEAHKLWKSLIAKRDSFVKPLDEMAKLVKKKIGEYDENKKRERAAEEARLRKEAIELEMKQREAECADLSEEEKQAVMEAPITIAPTVLPDDTPKGIVFREIWNAEVADLMLLVKAVAEGKVPLEAIEANQTYLRKRAEADKDTLNIPGVRPYSRRV